MMRYAPEPQQDCDWQGYPLNTDEDDETLSDPAPGWVEYAWEANRRLVINGAPPPPARVSEILTQPDITGLMINRLEPEFRDLHWLESDALRASTMRELEVTSLGAKINLRPFQECRHLDTVAVAPRLSRAVNFGEWRSPITSLGITQGSPVRYAGIESLQQLTFLSVDLPGASTGYLGHLPRLRELRLTAARKLTNVPLRCGQPVERLLIHQNPLLDLHFAELIAETLTELELDGVKSVINGEALRSCRALHSIIMENCGPGVTIDDLLSLMHEAVLSKVYIVGSALPFSRAECARLAREAPPSVHVHVPPI